ncbi:MAG: hypothetical protein GX601_05410 [Anaerolineales bacterium]|nr:hypothetical protein [Anaerolineales bacterium]
MKRAERIRDLIDGCISEMADDEKELYGEIAAYTVELGYTPKPVKTAHGASDALTFTKSRIGRTLLKIRPNHKDGKTQLVLSFFATPEYSDVFQDGIRRVIEEFDGKYTGCYGCGRCEGDEGYTYVYPDGRAVCRCGLELIELPPVGAEHADADEIRALMRAQDQYWTEKRKRNEGKTSI